MAAVTVAVKARTNCSKRREKAGRSLHQPTRPPEFAFTTDSASFALLSLPFF